MIKTFLQFLLGLRALGAVFGALLFAAVHARRVEHAAHDVVADARKVLHAAAAHDDDRVLLQRVADARNVCRDLHAVREPHARNLADGRVRLLRRLGEHLHAHAALEGRRGIHRPVMDGIEIVRQSRRFGLRLQRLSALFDELTDGRHFEYQRIVSEVPLSVK
jgi:hypothetical protein